MKRSVYMHCSNRTRDKTVLLIFSFALSLLVMPPCVPCIAADSHNSSGDTWWRFDSPGAWVQTAISDDGNYIVASSDKVYLFHKDSSSPLWQVAITGNVAISRDGSFIAVGSPDHHVYLFSKKSNEPLWSFDTGNEVLHVDISADGSHIVAGTRVMQFGQSTVYLFHNDNSIPVWNSAVGMEASALDISKDGHYIAVATNYGYPDKVYLFSDGSNVPLWEAAIYTPTTVALSADGAYLAAGDWQGNIHFFSKESSKPLWIHNTVGYVFDVGISGDGEYIAAAASAGVLLFNRNSNVPLWTYETPYTEHIAISPNGRYITAAGNVYVTNIILFSSESPVPIWNFNTGTWLNSIAISASSEGITAGDRDNGYVYFFKTGSIIRGEATRYTFTKIAKSTDTFMRFSNSPAISCSGVVAFYAYLGGSNSGIYVGDGRTVDNIFRTDLSLDETPSMNCNGDIVFKTIDNIFVSKDGLITTVATSDSAISIPYYNTLMINDIGTVAFIDEFQWPFNFSGIFKTYNGLLKGINIPSPISVSKKSINNEGVIVFASRLEPIGKGIFTEKNGTITTIITDVAGQFETNLPGINNNGVVVFLAVLDGGANGIFTIDKGVLTKVADTRDFSYSPYSGFEGSPLINDNNTVVFTNPNGDIYTGQDPINDKVIGTGDVLFGSIVRSVLLGGINNAGQIAFKAVFKDGSEGIFRADLIKKIDLSLKGDITQDGTVDLRDSVAAQQILIQSSSALTLVASADVNGDHRIGIEEAIFSLQIASGMRNHPPKMTSIGNVSVDEHSEITFTVSATDPDGDKLTFSVSGLPDGARFYPETRIFSWTPSYSQSGVYNITFQVEDKFKDSDRQSVTITVNDRVPTLADYFPLSVNNYWGYKDRTTGMKAATNVSGTKLIRDTLTYVVEDSSDSSGGKVYYSSDGDGLKLYGEYFPSYGDVYFDSPLLLISNNVGIGTEQISNTTYSLMINDTTFQVEFQSIYTVTGLENVQTEHGMLKDCFKVTTRYIQHIREYNQTFDSGQNNWWLCEGVGPVKYVTGDSDTIIYISNIGNHATLY